MDTIFINSENIKTSEYHVLELKLADKLDLRIGQKGVETAPIWSDEFELPGGSYSISDIQEYIFKKHSEIVDDPPIEIFVSKNENRVTFKIKN